MRKNETGITRLLTAVGLFILLFFSGRASGSEGGASFLDQGAGAVPRSLGGNYVGVAKGPEGIYWNSGALIFNQGEEIRATGYTAFETQYRSVMMNFRLNKHVQVGIGLIGATIEGLLKTSLNPMIKRYNVTGNEFGYEGQGYLGSLSTKITETIGIGITGKIITETLDQNHATGWGMDAGILAKLSSNLSLGINLHNIVPAVMRWDTLSKNTDIATQAVKLGWTYTVKSNFKNNKKSKEKDENSEENQFRIVSDITITKSDKPNFGLGMEYWLSENLPIRIGVKSDAQTFSELKEQILKIQNVSIGTGLKLNHWTIDLSWTNPQADYLDRETVISAGYRF